MQAGTECPVCKKPGLTVAFDKYVIPHFGEAMISLASCSECGYKHSDTLIVEESNPVEYTLKISCEQDMSVRVIRSSRATVEIPELGVKISPGSHSEGYITNVEGVLERIKEAIETGVRGSDKSARRKAEELYDKISLLKEGKGVATLHILDPSGNSAIWSKKAVKRS
ncbi:MAG: ZPR1 zinc finger domain-containing protein [Candidatus Hydrothermarchaeales archaeon]